jgi:hypothetical protein
MSFSKFALLFAILTSVVARGQDIVRQSIPQKWIEPVLPEDIRNGRAIWTKRNLKNSPGDTKSR